MKIGFLFLSLILSSAAWASGTTCKGTVSMTNVNSGPAQRVATLQIFPNLASLGKANNTGLQLDFGFDPIFYYGEIDPTGTKEQIMSDAHNGSIVSFHLKVLSATTVLFQAKFLDTYSNVKGQVYPATLTCN